MKALKKPENQVRDAMLLALKMEKGGLKPRNVAVSKKLKKVKTWILSRSYTK